MLHRKNIGWLIVATLVIGYVGSGALAQTKQLESTPMGVVVGVPQGWKIAEAKDGPPTACAEDGSAKLVLIYFEKQYVFEVMHNEKVSANFAPALKDAKIENGEKVVINGLIGMTASGNGTLDGKPVRFKCFVMGDKDNKPNTVVAIVVASEKVMKDSGKVIDATLNSAKWKDAK